MVQVDISEFTFGYAFLYEQTRRNWGNLVSAPVLPSLYAEASLGWDAHLPVSGVDYYYQFKVSEFLSRPNALLIRDGTFQGPYYRFWLHPKSNYRQHRHLKDLSLTAPFTYYVTQQVTDVAVFNQSFLDQDVTLLSRLIPLTECDDITIGGQHCIAFQEPSPEFVQCSVPKRHEISWMGNQIAKLYAESKDHW